MTEVVTSPHNQLVKMAAALKNRKYRDEHGLFAVEGIRLAEELVAAGWPTEVCLYTKAASFNPRAAMVLSALADSRCRLVEVSDPIYAKISDTLEPQGLMVIAPKRSAKLADLISRTQAPLIAVLDGIQDPGNAGTLIRTADAAGCSGVVLLKGCVDLYAGKTVRATMGSLFHLPVVEGLAGSELAAAVTERGISLAAATMEGSTPYFDASLSGGIAVVFGNEGRGVGKELLGLSAARIAVPIYGKAESLNVATAAAIILYEAARQRRSTL